MHTLPIHGHDHMYACGAFISVCCAAGNYLTPRQSMDSRAAVEALPVQDVEAAIEDVSLPPSCLTSTNGIQSLSGSSKRAAAEGLGSIGEGCSRARPRKRKRKSARLSQEELDAKFPGNVRNRECAGVWVRHTVRDRL